VLDGEIVIVGERGLDFDAVQLRLHPAQSRVRLLSHQIPASIVFFDILAEDRRDLTATPFFERRAILERVLKAVRPPIHVTPATRDFAVASDWFERFEGAGFDGVMAKPVDGAYEPNKRVMLKVKHERDCDCVVAGFRWHKRGEGTAIGSLLLGLYDADGQLQHVGVCASFSDAKRRELVDFLAPYRMDGLKGHPWEIWGAMLEEAEAMGQRRPGMGNRWNVGKDMSWQPLRPDLVVEVAYDHMQGSRFRHTAQFRRWRPDKRPRDCTFDQLEVVAPAELAAIFGKTD
jgi:ATP-dependent DNA ligase